MPVIKQYVNVYKDESVVWHDTREKAVGRAGDKIIAKAVEVEIKYDLPKTPFEELCEFIDRCRNSGTNIGYFDAVNTFIQKQKELNDA